MGMVDHLEQLGDKLRKTNDAAQILQIKIISTANEIEKSKNEQNELLADRRKLEKQTTYYEYCSRLLDSDQENSSLWDGEPDLFGEIQRYGQTELLSAFVVL